MDTYHQVMSGQYRPKTSPEQYNSDSTTDISSSSQSSSRESPTGLQIHLSPPGHVQTVSVNPNARYLRSPESSDGRVFPSETTTFTLQNGQRSRGDDVRRQQQVEKQPLNGRIVQMLDQIEHRIETLRDTAALMEDEKAKILQMLSTMETNSGLLDGRPGEREDIQATTGRLASRCRTVEVRVETPRTKSQQNALAAVDKQIDAVVEVSQHRPHIAADQCLGFLNACSPDQPSGPIDVNFQAKLIGCTADDQKKIRRRLEHLYRYISDILGN